MDTKALEARRQYQREYMQKWRENPENKQKERQYRQENKEKLKQNNINFFTRLAKEK